MGGGPLVLSGRGGAAPSWELTLSVLLLLDDSWPALALLLELLVEAEEAVESSLKEPRPRGGRCLSTGPYSSRPSAFLSTPPTMVATAPPGGKDTALPAGPMGEVGDSMGERDEVRGGGGGGRRCSPPTRPVPAPVCVRPSGWRGSSLAAAAAAELAARGSVLAAPGYRALAGVLTGEDWESELGKDGSRLTAVLAVSVAGAAVLWGVSGGSRLLLRLPASDGGWANVCSSSSRASSAFSARRRGCPSAAAPECAR